MKEKCLTIDVWDGDSLLHFGTCKLPLFELMRQSKGAVVKAK
jgi:hypothetical protein